MNDYEYEFRQDIKEKKSIGRNSRSMNRTGKGPIKFPSDYLTAKERKKLNGPVTSYDMGKPISYTAFKELPIDIRREYFQGMLNKFQPTDEAICEMWGVSRGTPTNIRKLLGIEPIKRKERVFDKDAWNSWLNTEKTTEIKPTPIDKEKTINKEKFVITPDPMVIPEQPVYISKDPEPKKTFEMTSPVFSGLRILAEMWEYYLDNSDHILLNETDVAAMLAMAKIVDISKGNMTKRSWEELSKYAGIVGESL